MVFADWIGQVKKSGRRGRPTKAKCSKPSRSNIRPQGRTSSGNESTRMARFLLRSRLACSTREWNKRRKATRDLPPRKLTNSNFIIDLGGLCLAARPWLNTHIRSFLRSACCAASSWKALCALGATRRFSSLSEPPEYGGRSATFGRVG